MQNNFEFAYEVEESTHETQVPGASLNASYTTIDECEKLKECQAFFSIYSIHHRQSPNLVEGS